MFRKIWVLALGLALVPAVSMAQKDSIDPSSINTYPNCGVNGNIVNNCGFETGDFTGWTQSGDLSFTGVNTNSAHHFGVAFFSNNGAFFGPVNDLGCITQAVPTPAFNYDISLWLTNVGQPSHFQIFWNGAALVDSTNVPNIGWTQLFFNRVFTVPATSTLMICFFNPPSFFYLDDIVAIASVGAPLKQ